MIWGVGPSAGDGLASAYVRARDADPKSSFGDVAALSRPVDRVTAELLRSVICDAVIAPGYEPGVVEMLAAKRGGRFLVLEADPSKVIPRMERREILGMTLVQERDALQVEEILPADDRLSAQSRADALLGLTTARYTQSNSVVFVRDGAAIGIGAGQQNRVDCVRLAGAKARTWWLRRHRLVDGLPVIEGMARQDRLNWQIRFAGQEMAATQVAEFEALFGRDARACYDDPGWRTEWLAALTGITMVSDGYLPFTDNVDHAAESGRERHRRDRRITADQRDRRPSQLVRDHPRTDRGPTVPSLMGVSRAGQADAGIWVGPR